MRDSAWRSREELALAERYLAVEQVRFGERLSFERADRAAAPSPCLVPPLLIQPLIENAVKHGVADRIEGGTVRVTARRCATARSRSRVENPRDPDAPPRRGAGHGARERAPAARGARPRGTRGWTSSASRESFRVRLMLPVPSPKTREAVRGA